MRILLADDHSVVRRGVRTLLESRPGWEICGEASNGWEAVELAKKLRPDVVVLDISMPELNGLAATRQIRKSTPDAKVLIFTLHDSEQMAREAKDAGAHGYVLKSGFESDLLAAVESLAERKSSLKSRGLDKAGGAGE